MADCMPSSADQDKLLVRESMLLAEMQGSNIIHYKA